MNKQSSKAEIKSHHINHIAADKLREIADLLSRQKANPFRIRAYQNAANTLDSLTEDIDHIVQRDGINGLVELPSIGSGIARSLYEFVATEKMTRLENLKGESDPVQLFSTIPGVGHSLAKRIHQELQLDSLESLEMAARDGRLKQLQGMGEKRLQAIQAWLYKVLGERRLQMRKSQHSAQVPAVELLLKIDNDYRRNAEAGKLPTITPKRFNPDGNVHLPILHSSEKNWHFTAIYSNTARAHDLHRTHDWVVIYFYDDHHQEGQYTVVTETHGTLLGKRVVRGREADCIEYYHRNDN